MKDWNVLVTTQDKGFTQAKDFLRSFGAVATTPYFNVLILRVENISAFLNKLNEASHQDPQLFQSCLSRVVPAQQSFTFQSPEEFEAKAKERALEWIDQLAGRSFYVRLHRRGFKGQIHSDEEERFLDETILSALEQAGKPGRISFDNPDRIIVIETMSNQAAMSLFDREDMAKYPFMQPDKKHP